MQVEGVRGEDVYQTIEREAVTHASPESFVFVVDEVSTPDTKRNFDGEEGRGEIIHYFQPNAVFLNDSIVRREKDLYRRKDDKTNNGIIDVVLPLFGVQVVVKDASQLLFECLYFSHCFVIYFFNMYTYVEKKERFFAESAQKSKFFVFFWLKVSRLLKYFL